MPYPLAAQLVPDNSLPNNSIIFSNEGITLIEGGTTKGQNLFHSFDTFNIPNGGRVFFNNGLNINNIFSRVTGDSASLINGFLGANGQANLFFMNPNGIILGPNAFINIGGSFLGTTANHVNFSDGGLFSSKKTDLLTSSSPTSLEVLSNSGSISIQGSGYSIAEIPILNPFFVGLHPGLRSSPGESISLVGNGINLTGGIITANSGNVDLLSIKEGTANIINNGPLQVSPFEAIYSDILLDNLALVDVSGVVPGSIKLWGNDINLTNGSFLLSRNLGNSGAGDIKIFANNDLTISGNIVNPNLPSFLAPFGVGRSTITSESLIDGKAANIIISAKNINLLEGGILGSRAFGKSEGGNIIISAEENINIIGFSEINPLFVSGVVTTTAGDGNSGLVKIEANNLLLSGGGLISSSTIGTGNGTLVRLDIKETTEITGNAPGILIPSTINANSFRSGDTGNIILKTGKLIVSEGGRIDSSAFDTGTAGNLDIIATESIEVSGSFSGELTFSTIGSSASIVVEEQRNLFNLPDIPEGSSGEVSLKTPLLKISDGATITTNNDGSGNAGNLLINAKKLDITESGSISAATAQGNGGNIIINATEIQLSDNSQISTASGGLGVGGNIEVNAQSLISQNSSILAATELGNGGNITFQLNTIQLFSGKISATAGGVGTGGNIDIKTFRLLTLDKSSITAEAFEGKGGNINIEANFAVISPDTRISASSNLGIDGEVRINGNIFQFQDVSSLSSEFEDTQILANSCLDSQETDLVRLTNSGNRGFPLNSEVAPVFVPFPNLFSPEPRFIRVPKGRRLATKLIRTAEGFRLAGDAETSDNTVVFKC